ncbi:MAG: hypothetical protein COB02_17825 [Candidatus Cloacimonadota bacterium]|nr:MAG: hypothetical protein COB02_17825 [Candidatus Cloacimonadota bacterium]
MAGINCTDYGSYNKYIKQNLNSVTTPHAVRDSVGDSIPPTKSKVLGKALAPSHLGNKIDIKV